MKNTVGIDIEGNLDLRHATRCRRNADKFEAAEKFIVRGHLPFALEDLDRNSRLVVGRSGEYL